MIIMHTMSYIRVRGESTRVAKSLPVGPLFPSQMWLSGWRHCSRCLWWRNNNNGSDVHVSVLFTLQPTFFNIFGVEQLLQFSAPLAYVWRHGFIIIRTTGNISYKWQQSQNDYIQIYLHKILRHLNPPFCNRKVSDSFPHRCDSFENFIHCTLEGKAAKQTHRWTKG